MDLRDLSSISINEVDLHNIIQRLNEEIKEAVATELANRPKRPEPAKWTRARIEMRGQYSKPKRVSYSTSKRARHDDVSARLDRIRRYRKEREMSITEEATAIASKTVPAARARGEKLRFRDEVKRIATALEENPRGTRQRYSKELSTVRKERYSAKPPAGGAPPVYTTWAEIAAQAAAQLYPDDPMRQSIEKRRILTELLDAAARKQTVGGVAGLYSGNPAMGRIIARAYANLSDRVADLATKDVRAGLGSFKARHAVRLEEEREKTISALNRALSR